MISPKTSVSFFLIFFLCVNQIPPAAAAGTLIAASAGVVIPVASAVAGAMTPPLALATGIGFLGSGVAQGVKFIIEHFIDKKKQEDEALKRQKKPTAPGPKTAIAPKLSAQGRDLRQQTQEWLRTLYPTGAERITGGAGQAQYDLPSLIALEGRLPQDPKTAGLFSYGSYWIQRMATAGEPGGSRRFFSIWGPPAGQATATGGYGTHRGVDFAAPKGSAVVVNQPATVLYADYSGGKNWGNMVALAYVEPTQDYGEFGFFGHIGRKQIKLNPDGSLPLNDNGELIGEDVLHVGILARAGDKLDPGRIIGVVGNTGRVIPSKGGDGTHLHYQHTVVTRKKLEWLKSKEFEQDIQKKIRNAKTDQEKKWLINLKEVAAPAVGNLYSTFLEEKNPTRKSEAAYNFLTNKAVQTYLTVNPVADKGSGQ